MVRPFIDKVVTANDLREGDVVYLTEGTIGAVTSPRPRSCKMKPPQRRDWQLAAVMS